MVNGWDFKVLQLTGMIDEIFSREHYDTTVDDLRGERIMIVLFYAEW